MDEAFLMSMIRIERNMLLAGSDWTQLSDSPLTEAKRLEWKAYRQKLRDLPGEITDSLNPVWPQLPSGK